jgi:acyl-CoA oxidase
MSTTSEHLRNALDGRWRDVRNRARQHLSNEVFRPHYTPNTVIARTKALQQLRIIAAAWGGGGRLQEGTRRHR